VDISDLRAKLGDALGGRLQSLQTLALGFAVAGALLTVVGFFMHAPTVAQSYLYAWVFWTGVSVGSLALLALHHTVGGGWGFILRRFLESGVRLLPVMAILFIPIALSIPVLYEWAHPEAAHDTIIRQKAIWLNTPGFLIRTVIYFAIWIGLGYFVFLKLGASQDERGDLAVSDRLNRWGAATLLIYVTTTTFAAVDWVMSLTPHWYSSIFGLLMVASQGLSTLALMLALAGYLGRGQRLIQVAPSGFFRDLGNLLLALTMLWAYMSFSQLIIIYSGNVAEEVVWYLDRIRHLWWVFAAINGAHFFLPFFVLLIRSDVKKNPIKLGYVALLIVVLRHLDIFWWVAPTFRKTVALNPADLGAPLLLGGIWLWVWAAGLKERTVLPVRDPRLEGALPLHQVETFHG